MTDNTKSFAGGLRAGTYNCTAPFATFIVSPNLIQIDASGKNFSFNEDQVIGLKKRRGGLQIHHIINDIPNLIVFWCNPEKVMTAIESVGFLPCASGEPNPDDEYELHKYLKIILFGFLCAIVILAVVLMTLSK
jgi:hypothetical protein